MKDAKGHGSNPRGAHAEGVDQIGRVASLPISGLVPTQSLDIGSENYDDESDKRVIDYFRAQLRDDQEIDPPIQVYPNGLIADGHHRVMAAMAEGKQDIRAETVPYGSPQGAQGHFKGE